MKYLFKIVLIFIVGFTLFGCQKEPQPMRGNWPITIDSSLQSSIKVLSCISRKRDDNLPEVQFTLKNRASDHDVDALFNVEWFNQDGFKIKSITDTFKKIHLGAEAEKTFRIISTSPKAKRYKIKIVDYDNNKQRSQHETIKNSN
ncbi:YcfL family protein [Sulfurospirillum sp. 1612]|uniref:YcfL family protein n=1 Tax=Sulfurospirillum sp. 1612 TaxID=3094835 RepID=UPI002F9512CC